MTSAVYVTRVGEPFGKPFAAQGLRFEWGGDVDPELEGLAWALPTSQTLTVKATLEHAEAVRIMDVLGGRPSLRGAAVCACHTQPFVAARDYRRRTKHRNRRRR